MRPFLAFLVLVGLFVGLVGSRFRASDGEKLAAVARRLGAKVRASLPPALDPAALADTLRRELPTRPEDAVRARLAADRRLSGSEITVVGEGGAVTLRGVAADATARKVALSLAENTAGVERVADELAVPAEPAP
jgi:hypothetical protein